MIAPTQMQTRRLSEFRDPTDMPHGENKGLLFVTRDAMEGISRSVWSCDGRLMLPSRKSGGLRGVNTDYLCIVNDRRQLADYLADYVYRNPHCMVSAGLLNSYPSKTCWLHLESLNAYGSETPIWSIPTTKFKQCYKFALYRDCVLGGTVSTASSDAYTLIRYAVQYWMRDRWDRQSGNPVIALSGFHDCRDEILYDHDYCNDIGQYAWYGPRSKRDWSDFIFRDQNKLFKKGE